MSKKTKKPSKMTARLDNLREGFVQAKQKFNEQIQGMLREEIDRLFTKFPTIQSISWNQYTPYFNDGDECVFGADIDCLTVHRVGEEADPTEVEPRNVNFKARTVRSWTYNHAQRQGAYVTREATESELFARQVFKLLNSAGNDVLKAAYGDHVTVILSRDGSSTEDYDHD